MLEVFRKQTSEIVTELKREGLAEFHECATSEGGPSFNVLLSPGALDRQKVILVVSGIPEETGVWSYTLLQQERPQDASMGPYFELARSLDWGIIALNPHGGGREGDRSEYHRQLQSVLQLLLGAGSPRTVVLVCFSAGGSIAFEFLDQHPELAGKIGSAILIDTTPPPLIKRRIKQEVKDLLLRTVLYGLEDEDRKMSAWASATSSVLGLSPKPIKAALHGELPNLLVGEVERMLKELRSP